MLCCVRFIVSDKQVNLKHPNFIATSNDVLHSLAASYLVNTCVKQRPYKLTKAGKNWARFFIFPIIWRHLDMTRLNKQNLKVAQQPITRQDVLHGAHIVN